MHDVAVGHRPTLVVEPICGLANRLLAWLSARRLAELCGRQMIVIWANNYRSQSAQSDCRLEQLFADLPPQRPSFEAFDPASLVRLVSRPRFIPWEDGPVTGAIDLDPAAAIDPDEYRSAPVLGITAFHPLLTRGDTYEGLMRAIAPSFAALAPIPRIDAAVRRFRRRHFDGAVLGIHIRRGDHGAMLKRLGIAPPADEDFWAYVDACLAARPDLRLFCASDDAGAKRRFLERYGARACGYDAESLARTTPTGVQCALVDLLLLSHASFICGTRASSFTQLGSLRNLVRRRSRAGCCVRLHAGICRDPGVLAEMVTRTLRALPAG